MAEGEVQQAINVIVEQVENLASLAIDEIVSALQEGVNQLKAALDDGGATSEQDENPDEEPSEFSKPAASTRKRS